MENRYSRPIIIILLLIIAFLFWTILKGGDTSPPEQTITFEEAKILEEAYQRSRTPILTEGLGFEDTRDFWFSLETIDQYLRYVKAEGKKLGKTDLGIRIYLGVYPEEGGYPQPGLSTVFFVPTSSTQEGSPIRQGFVPFLPTEENIEGIDALNYGTGGIPPNAL